MRDQGTGGVTVGDRVRGGTTVLTGAALTALAAPAAAEAAGGSPPAGGGATDQVLIGTLVAGLITGLFLLMIARHRSGKLTFLQRLADYSQRVSGLPGWAALPLSVAASSLIIAVLGMYWDISIHIDEGRDAGPFANTAHYLIIVGLFGITAAGMLAMALPKQRVSPTSRKLPNDWQVPLGGFLMFICAGFALAAFPMDDIWHRIFGQDVTLWGPTHLVLFGAAALSTIGTWILLVEGIRSAEFNKFPPKPVFHKGLQIATAGAFLIALSTFQGEFDFAVPQFRLDWQPILLAMAAGIGLVAARIAIGKGGALGAALFFILIRGLLSLWVGPLTGHTTLHFPLYLAEALVVEAIALSVPRTKPIRLGILSGIGIGTIGLAAEAVWVDAWYILPWPRVMLPEAAIAGLVTAVAAGVIGGFIGRSLASPWVQPVTRPRLLVPAAAAVLVGVFIYAGPISTGDPVKVTAELTEVTPAPNRTVEMTLRVEPPDAAVDARWFTSTSWQGGGSVVDRLRNVAPGVYETTKPIPVSGEWKTTLRLHKGSAVQGAPVYFPEDTAIPAPAVEATPTFTRNFTLDKKLLQREQKPDVSGALTVFAYFVVLGIALFLLRTLAKGLQQFDRISTEREMEAGPAVHEQKLGARRYERSGDGNGAAADSEEQEAARSGST